MGQRQAAFAKTVRPSGLAHERFLKLICTNVTESLSRVWSRKPALIMSERHVHLVDTRVNRDRIDRRTSRKQRYRLRRAAVVGQSYGTQFRIGIVLASNGTESA